jgi:hypothetical protein
MPLSNEELQADIDAVLAERDPVLCNLRITLAHRRLSGLLQEVTGADAGANFHSWAVWGSKKAGVTVRQEDLEGALRDASRVAGIVGAVVGVVSAVAITQVVLPAAGIAARAALGLVGGALGAFIGAAAGRAIARWSRREASRLVLEGNRLVLDDIGRQTARFYATFRGHGPITDDGLGTFLAGLAPGPAERGGQDLLREAFTQYARAANARDAREKQQAAYYANCLAILNEHVKLQPYILKSMPFIVRRCVTKRMLKFEIGPLSLSVSEDVPPLSGLDCPPTLADPLDPRLSEFLSGPRGWDRRAASLADSGAQDWTRLEDRMGYIVNLFRCFHCDGSTQVPPYDEAQMLAIEAGRVPTGRL